MSDGVGTLGQSVNDELAMGAPPDASAFNTCNTTREHHRHHGYAHGREEFTPRAVLASLPVAADGVNASWVSDRVRILKATVRAGMCGGWSAGWHAAARAVMQPVAHFSVARNNGTTTLSEFARLRGASGHGHARVADLPSANSTTSMSIPISMRWCTAAVAVPSSITTTPFPVNHAVSRSMTPTPENASPPANPGLSVFSVEEQAIIRNFLSAAHIETFERMWEEERALTDRTQTLKVRDRRARARMSLSRSKRDPSAAGSSSGADASEDDMVLGDRCNADAASALSIASLHDHRYDLAD
ncbi:hypothetical protein DFH11DRAFT_1833931 [Phellopilus nigrolimitatus]|nr:hypothetical protein DFH11DRAFT_1833931 [Phellopilus nigrolimitatus]